jgi:putative phosphoribosyl transferase
MFFTDRQDAGRQLGQALDAYARRNGVLVLALPRGGVPVAYEVAQAIGAPLDVFLVRKLGTPGQPELAMGAIASGGVLVVNEDVRRHLNVSDAALEAVAARERLELSRRERAYRDDRPPLDVRGQTVILIDDGLATGSTMRAAVRAVRALGPRRLVIAVPLAAPTTCAELADEVDEMICLRTPDPFDAVGRWYRDFAQTSDDEVQRLLRQAEAAQFPSRS